MSVNYCENCGLPEWAVSGTGVPVKITVKPVSRFKRRASTKTVWCHDEECALQALAISKYGRASHKWPITLAQFRAMYKLSARHEKSLQNADSKTSSEGLNQKSISEHGLPIFVTQKGRPRKSRVLSDAERARAYRVRQQEARDRRNLEEMACQ
jgi:hypothetical protein